MKSKHKKLCKHLIKSDKNGEKSSSVAIEDNSKNENIDHKNNTNKDNTKDSNVVTPQEKSESNENQIEKQSDENERQENETNENKEQNDADFVLHLKPDGGDVDELLQESDDNKVENKEQNKVEEKITKAAKVMSSKRIVPSTPSSTIGAVVVNKPKELEEEEDDYDLSRPKVGSVASVVRVTQRKSSVPIELQANKNLLLKAMKDANQSIKPNRKRMPEEVEYTPTPIKKRLGDKQEVLSNDSIEPDLDPKDLRNYLNVSKKGNSTEFFLSDMYPILLNTEFI